MKGDKKVQRLITEFVRMADNQPKTCRICGWVTSAKVARAFIRLTCFGVLQLGDPGMRVEIRVTAFRD